MCFHVMSRGLVGLAFVGFSLASLSACNPKIGGSDPIVRVDGATAALVNGDPLFLSEVELEAVAQGVIAPGDVFTPEHDKFQMIIDQLIDQRLLAQEAVRLRLDKDPEAQHRLQAARERILGNILVENLVALEVNEQTIQDMYAEQVRLQQIDDQVRLSHILVNTETEANEVHAELLSGEDFAATAFKYSIDAATRMENGDLGYHSPNSLDEPFPTNIGNTATGDFSTPFESSDGWHIIKIEERRTAPPKTLEEMRPQIVTFMTYAEIAKILKELRTSAVIELRNDVQPLEDEDAGELEPETPADPDPAQPEEDTL